VDTKNRSQVEMYNLQEDLDELHNVVNKTVTAEVRQDFQTKYLDPFLSKLNQDKLQAFEERYSQRNRPGIRRE